MFEKFTEKAINAITESQRQAKKMSNAYVQPEHLLLALFVQAKGVSLKLFKMYGISEEALVKEINARLRFEKAKRQQENVPFSDEFKNLLKNTLDLANKSGNSSVLFEHLFIAAIEDKFSYNKRILEEFNFEIENAKDILTRLVQKKSKKLLHPEFDDKESERQGLNQDSLFEDTVVSKILTRSLELLGESNHEILGTEQIMTSVLENASPELLKILADGGLNIEGFRGKLAQHSSRDSEFDVKKIVFTPRAFEAIDLAIQTAKEVGSLQIKPEHIILGILKAKNGLAYDVMQDMKVDSDELIENVLKPIEKQMPQALTILKLAKEEARRLGRNVVGTEMILLGIMSEGTGVGFKVLNDLEITLKDVRQIIEKLIGYGNEYYDREIIFTRRAKRVLEIAWQKAKKYNRQRIMSEHLLYAITTEASSVAMKTLQQLGVDAVEIRQGILKEIEG